jgi:hypothetical protein
MAWRFLSLGAIFMGFLVFFYATYVVGGEPLYFTNEKRYLTRSETLEVFWQFLSVSGPFFALGLLGVIFVPKR